jgi:DNA-binding NtrC family response regulator
LENAIQRAVLLTKSKTIEPSVLPLGFTSSTSLPQPIVQSPVASSINQPIATNLPLNEALEGPERQIILAALQANQWNRNLTADILGINRTTLYKKMKKLGIDDPSPQPK